MGVRSLPSFLAVGITLGSLTYVPVTMANVQTRATATLQVGSYTAHVQTVVAKDGKVTTTYMPIWYLLQGLKSLGLDATWDGVSHTLNITTPEGMPVGSGQSAAGTGSTRVLLNGKLIHRLNSLVAIDPSSKKPTVFFPIWYFTFLTTQLNLSTAWNGHVWSLQPKGAFPKILNRNQSLGDAASPTDVNGNVIVLGTNTRIQNARINGNVYLNPGSNGDVTLKNVTVTGQIVVESGATHSIHLDGVAAPQLVVASSSPVHIVANGGTAIQTTEIGPSEKYAVSLDNASGTLGDLLIESAPSIMLSGTTPFPDVIVAASANVVVQPGTQVNNVQVSESGAAVTVQQGASVTTVNVTGKASVNLVVNGNVGTIASTSATVTVVGTGTVSAVQGTGVQGSLPGLPSATSPSTAGTSASGTSASGTSTSGTSTSGTSTSGTSTSGTSTSGTSTSGTSTSSGQNATTEPLKIAQVDPGAPPENGLLATPVLSVNNNIVSWSPALDATWIDMTLKTAGDPAQTYNVQTLASDGYLDLSGAAPSGNYQLQAQYAGNVDGIPYGNSLQSQATGVSVNPTSMPGANYGGSSGATYVSAYQAPTFDPSSLIVSWIPMGGASMYFIQGNPQSSGGSSWESGVPTDYVTYQNGEYSWSIAGTPIQSGDYSIQVSGISSSGSVVAQTYGTAANIQEIDAPIGGTLREDADGNLTVSWNPVQGASVYNIQLVAQNPSDSNNPYEAGFWSTSTSYTFSADDVKELAQMTNGQGGNFTVSVIAQGPGYAASQSSVVGSVYFVPNY